eukprot:10258517-Alexandrium_andersonii.AAC.1
MSASSDIAAIPHFVLIIARLLLGSLHGGPRVVGSLFCLSISCGRPARVLSRVVSWLRATRQH